MPDYLLFFNQQWVPDRPAEWFHGRAAPAMACVNDMKEAGVYLYAGGLVEELDQAWSAEPREDGETLVTDGPFSETKEWLGGFPVVRVADVEEAKHWGARIAEACGWPHEIRELKSEPDLD